jgi:DNA-binding transcriptional LysR family regulator
MEFRVLQYFLAVVRERSITRAAESLHITQPTLSRQLAQLEGELGVRLFSRGARNIELTDEGMLLRRRAEEILELAAKTEQELFQWEKQLEGTIAIGMGELYSVEILAKLCRKFREKYPLVRFEYYTAAADAVKERMQRGIIDIGLLLEPVDMERYDFVRLGATEKWCVLLRADDELSKKAYLTAQDLARLPLSLPSRLGVQSELASWFGDYFDRLNIAFSSNLTSNSIVMVRRGMGYAVVVGDEFLLGNGEVVSRPLYPELTATTVLAWKRGQVQSRAVEKFIAEAKCFLGMADAKNLSI